MSARSIALEMYRMRHIVELADAWEEAVHQDADVYGDELPEGMTREERDLIRAVRDWRFNPNEDYDLAMSELESL